MNLLTIQTIKDESGVTKARSFLHYETRDDAMAALYNTMWASVSDKKVIHVVCEIINDEGNAEKRETYTRILPAEQTAEVEEGGLE